MLISEIFAIIANKNTFFFVLKKKMREKYTLKIKKITKTKIEARLLVFIKKRKKAV